jgi:hypothetical protein
MIRIARVAALALAAVAAALWAGCDSEQGALFPNQPPNTRISAGPPEASDTSFEVNVFWFGWDDDGFVDYYEIAWETPTDWQGPIFAKDSLFIVAASETCCVDPLPDYLVPLPDSVYSQYHTFYVRSVDNLGVPDETPAVVTFNAKTIAPTTTIVDPSPGDLRQWGTEVEFNWVGNDVDGLVVGYRYALTSREDMVRDTGIQSPTQGQLTRWLDTITYYPNFSGGYFTDSLVWRFTDRDSVLFPNVTTTTPPNFAYFGVRAIDDAGAEEQILTPDVNTRRFFVTRSLNGPRIFVNSNILGTWRTGGTTQTRDVFAGQGLRFRWRAIPGPSGAPVAGYSFAVDDTSRWTPYSLPSTEFPEQPPGGPEELWFPEGGPHTFYVRAIDAAGFVRVLAARLKVFLGPRFAPAESRYILIVVDSQPGGPQESLVWPLNFEEIEVGLVHYYFEGYNYVVHETSGALPPTLTLLDWATSCFWFHSAEVGGQYSSSLQKYHQVPPNPLPSYVASGGNLFICGVQPVHALRYYEATDGTVQLVQNTPVDFGTTIADTSLVDHWMAAQFGISRILETWGDTNTGSLAPKRVRTCTSQITTGANPYPDLPFDPLSWPSGPILRGFGYYDRGIELLDVENPAEVIYTANESQDAIAIRRLTQPGVNGNVMYVGFHHYFVERPAFRQFIRAVLTDFGETPSVP